MAMNGMAEAAQDELVTRYFEQAVAQGMDPFAALELAQKAASDMLGPLRQAATSEEIYGTASAAERMAAPRLAMTDVSASPVRRSAPTATPRPAPVTAPGPEPMADLMVMPRSEPMVLPRPEMMSAPRPEPMAAPRVVRSPGVYDMAPDVVMSAQAPRVVRSPGVYEMAPDVAMEAPRVVRSPGVYEMAPDTVRDLILEEAAARAFDAPPPPPVTLERASLADSLLRALGLR